MTKPMGEGMKALQTKVAKHILSANEKKRSREPKTEMLLLKMRPDFKVALIHAAKQRDRSMTNLILRAVAKDIKWEGEI